MNFLKRDVVLVEERAVTPRYIKEIKARYGLSFEDMDRRMGYAPNSNQSQHAVSYPQGRADARTGKPVLYLNERYAKRFLGMVAQLKKERGDVYGVVLTNGAKMPPRTIGLAGAPRRCARCGKKFYELPPDGYCSEGCREKRRKGQTSR